MSQNIIAGIITAFLLGVFAAAWNTYIMPFFIENLGERIKIYPTWVGELDFGSGNLHGVKICIEKLGYKVTGELEFTSGKHKTKKYHIFGRFQSNILTFHYFPFDKHSTSQGTATVNRLKDGELLSGYFAYYSQDKHLVDTVKCEFTPIGLSL